MRTYIAIVLSIAAIGVAAYFLSGSISGTHAPKTKEFSLRIEHGALAEGSGRIAVNVDDTVVLTVISDEEEEFHLHGYDRSVDLEPHIPATLTITANASGRFVFELEHSKIELGALEVLP